MLRAACSSLFLLGLITEAHAAESGTTILTDNDLFVVVDAVASDVAKIPTALDRVTVGLKDGRVTYFSKNEAISDPEPRMIVVQIKDTKVVPLQKTSGYPDAFPRPRINQVLTNDRVTVWDYTWVSGEPTPVHFHAKRVVVTYLADGTLRSTTLDGKAVDNKHTYGLVTFNPVGRLHTETLVEGESRAVIIEFN